MNVFILILVMLFTLSIKDYKEKQLSGISFFNKSFFYNEKEKVFINKYQIILIFAFLILVSGLRALSIGTDTLAYEKMYRGYEPKELLREKEFVFWLLVVGARTLRLSFTSFLFIFAVIQLGCVYVAIKKYSKYPFLSLLLFVGLGFYTFSFNGLRQSLALAFFILAVICTIEKKPIKYIVFIVLTILCHSSAIILLPMYLLRYIKSNKWLYIILTLATFGALILLPQIIKFVSRFTSQNYYELYYINSNGHSEFSMFKFAYFFAMLLLLIWFLYCRKNIKDQKEIKSYNVFLLLYSICVCIKCIAVFSGLYVVFNRLTIYFFWTIIFLIPYSLKYLKNSELKFLYSYGTFVGSVLYFAISTISRSANGVYPYSFIFNFNSFGYWTITIVMLTIFALVFILQLKETWNFERRKLFKQNKYYCSSI